MISDTLIKHDELFEQLLDIKSKDNSFLFMPRQTNKNGRLDQGFWFPGDEEGYISINFYTGGDSYNKTGNITFVMILKEKNGIKRNTCCIQLNNSAGTDGYLDKAPIINEIINTLGDFKVDCTDTTGKPRRWNRYYKQCDYLANLREFALNDKPIIDQIINKHLCSGIDFLPNEKSLKKIENIIERRKLYSNNPMCLG